VLRRTCGNFRTIETVQGDIAMKTFTATIAAAACVAGLAAAPAAAQTDDNIRVQVNYADLDIGSDAGAAALASRIESNVARACARSDDGRQLKLLSVCQDQLITAAVEQLESKGAANVAGHLALG
jgi:UrcA family protein